MLTLNFLAMLTGVEDQFAAALANKHPVLSIIFTLLPLIVAGLKTLSDQIGKRAHQQKAKATLEILKMKYEIEAIRRREQLDLPPIPVTTEELQASVPQARAEVRFFQSERLRTTFTFRNIVKHPKGGKVFANFGTVVTAFYGIAMVGQVFGISSSEIRMQIGPLFVAGLVLFCMLTGAALLLWAVRIHKAKQLAMAELDKRMSPKPEQIRDKPEMDKTKATLPPAAA